MSKAMDIANAGTNPAARNCTAITDRCMRNNTLIVSLHVPYIRPTCIGDLGRERVGEDGRMRLTMAQQPMSKGFVSSQPYIGAVCRLCSLYSAQRVGHCS